MSIAIVQKDHPVLRQKASPVPLNEIGSKRFQDIIGAMIKALEAEQDGVAIAAPQIAELWRIFVISKKVGELINSPIQEHLVFINPEITKISKNKISVEEGCLSVRWLYGKTRRANKATVRAYDKNGKIFERGGSGLLAQIFQHEIDHLNGILFTDHAKNLEDLPPSKHLAKDF